MKCWGMPFCCFIVAGFFFYLGETANLAPASLTLGVCIFTREGEFLNSDWQQPLIPCCDITQLLYLTRSELAWGVKGLSNLFTAFQSPPLPLLGDVQFSACFRMQQSGWARGYHISSMATSDRWQMTPRSTERIKTALHPTSQMFLLFPSHTILEV